MNIGTITLTLTATAAQVAGAPPVAIISRALASNTDASDHTVTVYSGSTVIVNAYTVPAGKTTPLPLAGVGLVSGVILYAKADTTSVVTLNLTTIQP